MASQNYNTPAKEQQLNTALELAAQGWHVIPCREKAETIDGKIYAVKTPYTQHGLKDATTDPELIRKWGERWPSALVGIACEKSGLFALDIDIDESKGINGFYTLAGLIDGAGNGQALLPTVGPVQQTPRGGQHYIFKLPYGVKIPNTAGLLGPGLDLRSNGYICTGAGYKWLEGHDPETPLTDAPAWLLDLIRELTEKPAAARTMPQVRKNGGDPAKSGDFWLQRALTMAVPGTRNQTGFWLGCQLRDANIPQSEAELIACQYAAHVTGEGYTEGEAVSSIRSAYSQAPRAPAHGSGSPIFSPQVASDNKTYKQPLTQAPEVDINPTIPTPGDLSLDDIGNGERLARRHGARLRYVQEWGWLTWNGKTWEKDRGLIALWCKETARSILAEAAACEDDGKRNGLIKHARNTSSQWKLDAMATLAQSEPGINAAPKDFDKDPWLINCQNGIVDLKTGELRPHDPAAHMTKITAADYDPTASAPLWDAFLKRVFNDDFDLIYFVQKAVGYSLTGFTGEQVLFFLFGRGANGKSTFTGAIQDLLADYGMKTRAETLMIRAQDVIPEEVAQLAGVRFMLAAELGEGQRLNESLIKDLTGGDRLRARLLHRNSFEFIPSAKPWLYGNHKPSVKGTDEGIWRRVKLIPFTVTIPEDERDKTMPEKLRAELPGILAWAVHGCLAWQAEGLGDPQAVIDATREYRTEQDILAAFLDERCLIKDTATVTAGVLYTDYKTWAENAGMKALTRPNFSRQLEERGFTTSKREAGTGRAVYTGLGLLTEAEKL